MSISLSPSENQQVEAKRKSVKPFWYNANSGQWTPISDDFEAFLILTPISKKKSAVDWLNTLSFGLNSNTARTIVAQDFLARELSDITLQLEGLNALLTPYSSFRSDFVSGTRFLGVSEVASVLEDSRLGIDRIIELRTDLKHRSTINTAVQTRETAEGVTETRKTQAKSWAIPLLTPYF